MLPFPVELLRFLERATPPDITNTDTRNTAEIVNPTPRPEPPDVASATAEPMSGAGACDNGAAREASLSVPLRQGPSRWWG